MRSQSKPLTSAPAVLALLLGLSIAACGSDDNQAALTQVSPDRSASLDGSSGDAQPAADVVLDRDTVAGDDTDAASDTEPSALLDDGAPCDDGLECESGWCLPTTDGRMCAPICSTTACPLGRECRVLQGGSGGDGGDGSTSVCVDRFTALCTPCDDHESCNGGPGDSGQNRCVRYGDLGRFCGVACGQGRPACPDGWSCGAQGQCKRADGVCECSPWAASLAASTECSLANDVATCFGRRSCDDAGAMGQCDALMPSAEVCNGVDDDCDGETDEGDLHSLCGGFACDGEAGCKEACASDEDCAPGLGCVGSATDGRMECVSTGADGSPCDGADSCDSAYCQGGVCCQGPGALCCDGDDDCGALDGEALCFQTEAAGCGGLRRLGRCESNVCVVRDVDDPSVCVNAICQGGACTAGGYEVPHICDAQGQCQPSGPDQSCDDGDACTVDGCSVADGCTAAPVDGPSGESCYTHDPATRGVGACSDGVLGCDQGVASSCEGDGGPSVEVCNGSDDDCDGTTDEETDEECAPFGCAGAIGCYSQCGEDAHCAAGHYCDGGACVSAGESGSPCEADGQCQSDHCANGVCCDDGFCCVDDDDCSPYDAQACTTVNGQGCAGTRTRGLCNAASVCVAETVVDPSVCVGLSCDSSACEGGAIAPSMVCRVDGACAAAGAPTPCGAWACADGACSTSCAVASDGGAVGCAAEATCIDGVCVGVTPNGGACGSDAECASDHCEGGFCCSGGLCCGEDADCVSLTEAPTCENVGSCGGTQVIGVCGGDSVCGVSTVPAPDGCLGKVCGDASCTNLSGGGAFKEGIIRQLCNDIGVCEAAIHDCRDLHDQSFCVKKSTTYSWCEDDCKPKRVACFVPGTILPYTPCYCE